MSRVILYTKRKFYSINLLEQQILTSRFEIKGDLYMKATGIVRRIEAHVIITQKCVKSL